MRTFFCFLAFLCTVSLFAQNNSNRVENILFSQLNVSLRVNTLGIGVEAATPLTGKLKLRAGLNVFPFSLGHHSSNLKEGFEQIEDAFGYIPGYWGKWDVHFMNGHILFDIHPIRNSVFHITTGFFVGSSKIKLNGYLSDANNNQAQLLAGYEWPVIEIENNVFDFTDGILNFDMKLNNIVKPYLGIGIEKGIARKRFGFKFEIGMVYQGDYTLKQNGNEFKLKEAAVKDLNDIDDYAQLLKWWPMVNFQLVYRIF